MTRFGTWTALITPFRDRAVDLDCLQHLIQEQIRAGIDGLVLLGTTGEAFALEKSERALIIKTAKERAGANLGLFVGCGTSSTRSTLENALQAQELGADGVMIVTPPYVKPNFSGMSNHIKAICDQIHLPIMLYNNPARCGRSFDAESLLKLCSHERVVAIKESGVDLEQIAHFALKKPAHIALLAGDDTLLFPMLALGAEGVVSVSSNVMPAVVKELVDALFDSHLKRARICFAKLFPLIQSLGEQTNPIAIKYLMEKRQLCSAEVRCPLGDLEASAKRRIDDQLIDIFAGNI